MGPLMANVAFAAGVPNMHELAAEAERLGSLKIECVAAGPHHSILYFAEHPEGRVTVRRGKTHLYLTDYSMVAPILFELILNASENLGAQPNQTVQRPELQLPIRIEDVRKASKQVHRTSAIVVFVLLTAVSALAALAFGIFRWLSS